MARVYYPRQGFAKYLGNDKALLDYLALISDIKLLLDQLVAALPEVVTATMLNETGDPMLNENGDPMLEEAA